MPGLFNKEDFKDNCGFGLVANINGVKLHKVITNSIDSLALVSDRSISDCFRSINLMTRERSDCLSLRLLEIDQ